MKVHKFALAIFLVTSLVYLLTPTTNSQAQAKASANVSHQEQGNLTLESHFRPENNSTLSAFAAGITSTSTFTTYMPIILYNFVPAQTLREAANRLGIEMGGHGLWWKVSSTPQFKQLLEREYNLYLSDCDMCWSNIRPTRDTFNFYGTDTMVGQAKNAGMKAQAHHLLWGYRNVLPTWLKDGTFTKQELRDIIQNHIQTVVTRYKAGSAIGQISEWSVVNEMLANGPDGSISFFTEKLEDDPQHPTYAWAEDAFRWANAADPTAKLFLNDYYFEFGGSKTDQLYNIVSSWKSKGVPIHGIGFQMHLWGNDFVGTQMGVRMAQLANTIQRFRALGLEVYVTEFDIDMAFVTGADRLDFQGQIYRNVVATCLDNGVKSISFMGLTDAYSWLEQGSSLADATLFDDNYNKKPAYYQVLDELNHRIH